MTQDDNTVQITGLILEEQTELSLDDLCRACAAEADRIIELVNEGVLAPAGDTPDYWRFTGVHLQRARVALRLENDLGVNLAGAELDSLRERMQMLEAAGH